jgi:p-hydroxybenzoate 3-monooxygenase
MSQDSPTIDTVIKTDVAIVGAGPAGLLASHLLSRAGVSSVAIDTRQREVIEQTHRAGILEGPAARLLVESGVSDRILREGHEHEGTIIRSGGLNHRIDFKALVGESVWLYPQTDVFLDLANARARDGGDVRFGVSDVQVDGVDTERPEVTFTDGDGSRVRVRAAYVIGSDGSRSICRDLVPEASRVRHFREYPFAWFGIIAQVPQAAPELVYTSSDHGFALLSHRTDTVQRLYFQCAAADRAENWSEEQIWARLQQIVAGRDGFVLEEGPVLEKTVLPFRSFVQEPMRWGRLLLAGDAAHTVPPTGARGLNLAIHDVRVLVDVLVRALAAGDVDLLADYEERALRRVWKAQNFSYWMTQMMHVPTDGTDFDRRRQQAELDNVVSTDAGRRYLAEQYTGWPNAH